MKSHEFYEHNYWLIEALEEARRVAENWNLADLEARLDELLESAIIILINSRPVTNYLTVIRVLLFVTLRKKDPKHFTPSPHFCTPRDEVCSGLKDLAEYCREIGENELATKIQQVADGGIQWDELHDEPLETKGNVLNLKGRLSKRNDGVSYSRNLVHFD